MDEELRPIPILEGAAAKRFYRNVSSKKITSEQKEYLASCADLLAKSKLD